MDPQAQISLSNLANLSWASRWDVLAMRILAIAPVESDYV